MFNYNDPLGFGVFSPAFSAYSTASLFSSSSGGGSTPGANVIMDSRCARAAFGSAQCVGEYDFVFNMVQSGYH